MREVSLRPGCRVVTPTVPIARTHAGPSAQGQPAVARPTGDLPLAQACCDRWADGAGRPALLCPRPDGSADAVSFDALRATSSRLAHVLRAQGVGRRDRVAILLPQGAETVVALLAAWRIGATAVPLARMLDGPALAFRLQHAGAVALVTDDAGLAATAVLRPVLQALRLLLCTDGARAGALSFWEEVGRAADGSLDEAIAPEDPALILYTAGPAGQVRGVLHAHRALHGQLPGVAAQHGGFPREGDRMWTPTDWAWRSGLFDALLPALWHGVAVLAAPMPRFDAVRALGLMARHGVRNAVLPVATLRALRGSGLPVPDGMRLRSIATSGETPERALGAWAEATLGAALRHGHGVAECNLVLTGCEGALPSGRPVPGHALAVIGQGGETLPAWETGRLAVKRDHPGVFLGYWDDPQGSARMLDGDWMPTGDLATMAEDGAVLLPEADADAVAPPGAGDGMGPDDVEHCLRRHPAVALAAVIGPADALAGEDATAIIVPRGDATPGPALAEELRDFMRASLFGHRYPRRVAFAKVLPRAPEGRGALGSAVGLGAQRG
jgi:acetyl-CoA synthetase